MSYWLIYIFKYCHDCQSEGYWLIAYLNYAMVVKVKGLVCYWLICIFKYCHGCQSEGIGVSYWIIYIFKFCHMLIKVLSMSLSAVTPTCNLNTVHEAFSVQ